MRFLIKAGVPAAIAAAALWAAVQSEEVCEHPDGDGVIRPVDPAAVGRAQEKMALQAERVEAAAASRPDRRLPACGGSSKRVISVAPLPESLRGKTFDFPSDVPIPPDLAELLRVRCVPSRVRVLDRDRVEVTEP